MGKIALLDLLKKILLTQPNVLSAIYTRAQCWFMFLLLSTIGFFPAKLLPNHLQSLQWCRLIPVPCNSSHFHLLRFVRFLSLLFFRIADVPLNCSPAHRCIEWYSHFSVVYSPTLLLRGHFILSPKSLMKALNSADHGTDP